MKCKFHDCENEVEEGKRACPSCYRKSVMELVAQHAMIYSDWRHKCAGPIRLNQITEEEVEEAVRLRGGTVQGSSLPAGQKHKRENDWQPLPSENLASPSLSKPSITEKRLAAVNTTLKQLAASTECDSAKIKEELAKLAEQLDQVLKLVQLDRQEKEQLQRQIEIERQWHANPPQQPIKPAEATKDPYRIDWKRTSRPLI